MEVVIGIGIEDVFFGMDVGEVTSILGKPDRINKEEKENGIVLYYYEKMIKCKFDISQNERLYSIEVYNQTMTLFKSCIIAKSKNEIKNLLQMNGFATFIYYDYDSFDTIFCKEIYTTFAFRFDKLFNLEFSPLKTNEYGWIWPKRK